jgi:hypothetical protein
VSSIVELIYATRSPLIPNANYPKNTLSSISIPNSSLAMFSNCFCSLSSHPGPLGHIPKRQQPSEVGEEGHSRCLRDVNQNAKSTTPRVVLNTSAFPRSRSHVQRPTVARSLDPVRERVYPIDAHLADKLTREDGDPRVWLLACIMR